MGCFKVRGSRLADKQLRIETGDVGLQSTNIRLRSAAVGGSVSRAMT